MTYRQSILNTNIFAQTLMEPFLRELLVSINNFNAFDLYSKNLWFQFCSSAALIRQAQKDLKLPNRNKSSINNIKRINMLQQSTLAFVHFQEIQHQARVYRLGQLVPTFYSASKSVILSLAAYITWKFPYLPHPHYPKFQIGEPKVSETFPAPDLSSHPLHEAWADSLCKSVIDGNAMRENSTLYILIPIKSDYSNQLEKLKWKAQTYSGKTTIQKIFGLQDGETKEQKIILMNLAVSQLRQNQLAPKINFPALLLGTIFNNQQWSFYCALKGEIPTEDELRKANTIILPGSNNSALDSIEPVDLLVTRLMKAYEENPKLKILSLCYGHQLMAKFYGAELVRKHRFEGHETVKFDKTLTSHYAFLQKITGHLNEEFIMPEHHEDYVETVPEGFDLIATSKSCYVEGMVKRDGRIFSLQFHPEYFSEYTVAFNKRAQLAESHYHLSFALAVEEHRINYHHESCTFVRECIKDFIASDPSKNLI